MNIDPVNVYIQNINFINLIYQSILGTDSTRIPKLKIGIMNNGTDTLDKLFVIEDNSSVLLFIKHVLDSKGLYRRTAYMIVRSKIKYVHFKTGKIFDTFAEFAELENDYLNRDFKFLYEGREYMKLKDIRNPTSEVQLLWNNGSISKVPNIHEFIDYKSNELQTMIGYYIPESSYINFHPVAHYGNNFGDYSVEFIRENFNKIYEPGFITWLVNIKFSNTFKNKRKDKSSLVVTTKQEINIQSKMLYIGSFICEMLFGFFFFDK